MRSVLRTLVAVTLVAGAIPYRARAADEEKVANPPFKHWSAFKVGTTVTHKERVTFPKESEDVERYPGGVHEKDMTYRLLEVAPEKVVVELKVLEYGHGYTTELAPVKITYPASVQKEHVLTAPGATETIKEGDEDLKVLGKTIRCHWIESIDKDRDELFYRKMWSSDEVPGGIVKDIKTQKKGRELVSESNHVVVSFRRP